MGEGYEKVSASFQEKFHTQQQEIQNLSTVVLETQKSMKDNAETLHSILTGMENLGDHVRELQEGMMPYDDVHQMAEDQYAQVEDQLLKEVPIAKGAQSSMEKENPPAVSVPAVGAPILPTIPEEFSVQAGNPKLSMTESEEQDMSKRWNRLRQTGPFANVQQMNPVMGNKGKVPERDQSTIPNFFDFDGSVKIPQFDDQGELQNTILKTVPLPMSLPPMNIDPFPKRINPIPVNPQREVHMTSKGIVHAEKKSGNTGITSGKGGEAIDLRTETTATSRNTPHPTFGSTTIDTAKEQRIHTIVCRVMEEKYGQGRAALREHLGLAPEDPKLSKESVAPSVPMGTEVPRTSFGSPLSIDGVSPSVPSVSTGSQPFATVAWKPKEPPCFFGRSTEDAHTWVSLVRNYLTFMSGSDSQ